MVLQRAPAWQAGTVAVAWACALRQPVQGLRAEADAGHWIELDCKRLVLSGSRTASFQP